MWLFYTLILGKEIFGNQVVIGVNCKPYLEAIIYNR